MSSKFQNLNFLYSNAKKIKATRIPKWNKKNTNIFKNIKENTIYHLSTLHVFKNQQRSKKREGPTFGVGESGGWREVVDDDQEVEENGEEDREDKEEEKGESSKLSKYSYYNYEYLTMLEK